MVFKYYGNSGYMNCTILSFFDKLHLTPPDMKLGRGGWVLCQTSGCTKVLSRSLFFCAAPHLTTFDNKWGSADW